MSGAPSLPEQVPRTNKEANGVYTSTASFQIHDQPVENLRPLKVIVIGAGFSGLYCGIRIPERLRNVELVIYEKNAGYGALYAPAPEIRACLENTAKKYSIDRFVKLSHKVNECRWDEKEGKWHLKITDLGTGRSFEDSAEVVVNARGGLNEPSWPIIEGLNSFEGKIMHSAIWDESYEFKDRKIGIIGLGSSSIQIVPKLQAISGAHLSVFARGKTWISPSFGQQLWDKMGLEGFDFTEEQRDEFTNNPDSYQKFRLAVEEDSNGIHGFTMKDSPMQKGARQFFTQVMKQRLASSPEIFDEIIPSFAPGCRRLTPGPGYLEALSQPNVSFVSTAIKRIEVDGIRTTDEEKHNIDTLICATGFKPFVAPPFPIIGRAGVSLADHWSQYPRTYVSLATDDFPNHFFMLGPNGGIGAGSLTMMMEATGDYIVKCIRKLQKENYKSMAPKAARVKDFVEYAAAYFPGTIYKDQCRSWYKNAKDEVTGLWPGSTLHCIETLRSPRWEDWKYEDEEQEGHVNQLAWLGNGWSNNQTRGKHLGWYLLPEFLEEHTPLAPRPEESERLEKRPFSY